MAKKARSRRTFREIQTSRFADTANASLDRIGALLDAAISDDDCDVLQDAYCKLLEIKALADFLDEPVIAEICDIGQTVVDLIRKNHSADLDQAYALAQSVTSELNRRIAFLNADEAGELPSSDTSELASALTAILNHMPAVRSESDESLWPAAGGGLSPEMVEQFSAEAGEHLQVLETSLLELEQNGDDPSTINSVFRAIHSIKGTADYVGLTQIKTLSHHVETILDLARSHELQLTNDIVSLVFEGVDALSTMVADLTSAGEADRNLSELVKRLLATANKVKPSGTGKTASSEPVRTEETPMHVFVNAARQHVECIQQLGQLLLEGGAGEDVPATMLRSVSSLRMAANYVGQEGFAEPCDSLNAVLESYSQQGASDDVAIRATLVQATDSIVKQLSACEGSTGTRPLDSELTEVRPTEDVKVPDATAGKSGAASIRVDQRKLDEYIGLAGELVIARNSLDHCFREFQNQPAKNSRELKSAIEGVDRIAGAIQKNAMGMRMVPVRQLFQRFPRLVRDVAKLRDKEIELQTFGEDTEIDKQVAEALGDPLVHIVRNAADHGIEPPEERVACGKSATGQVTLRAGREGSFVVIEISDDGSGICTEKLKAKALRSGVITEEQAEAMSEEEAYDLIFAAGLSTAEQITEVSGRGVGMDVVRTNVEKLGGTVGVYSEQGQGTSLRVQIPLTLAVTSALLVKSDSSVFAVPLDVIEETVKVSANAIKNLRGHYAVSLRDRIVPVKSLSEMLQPSGGPSADSELKLSEGRISIVVIEVAGELFGLAVDQVIGQQEIVLKPLPDYLANLRGMGSATVMGDGTIVLILDVLSLYRELSSDLDEFAKQVQIETTS